MGERTSGLDQRVVAGTGISVLDSAAGEDHTIADHTVTSNLGAVTEHAVIAHDGIVADVCTFKDEVAVADLGNAIAVGTAVDDHILTDHVIVADLYIRLSTTEIEVLRQSRDDAALMDLVAFTDSRSITDGDEGEDDAVITNHHIVLNIHEGEYLTVIADFRLWRNLGLGGYFACHIILTLSS